MVSISLWLLKLTKIFTDRMLGAYQSQYEWDNELKIFTATTELTVTILQTLTVSDLHVLFYIFLCFIGKCVICTILTYKFSYIFLA